jgi:hypothetical protein
MGDFRFTGQSPCRTGHLQPWYQAEVLKGYVGRPKAGELICVWSICFVAFWLGIVQIGRYVLGPKISKLLQRLGVRDKRVIDKKSRRDYRNDGAKLLGS